MTQIPPALLTEADGLARSTIEEILPGAGTIPPAKDAGERFDFLWREHLAEASRVAEFFRLFAGADAGQIELSPAAKRQICLRLTGAIQLLSEIRAGRAQLAIELPAEDIDASFVLATIASQWGNESFARAELQRVADLFRS